MRYRVAAPIAAVATALILSAGSMLAFHTVAEPHPRALPPPSQPAVDLSQTLDREQAADRASRSYLRHPFPTPTPTPVAPKPKPTPKPYVAPPPVTGHDPTLGLTHTQRAALPFDTWLGSPTARRVLTRESHGSCTAVNPSGKYRGRWQMDSNFWKAYGGLTYAPRPDAATCHEQDLVAHRGWIARGWQPWTTA